MPNLGEACSVHTTATAATSAKTFVDATGSNSSNNNNNNNNNNKHNKRNNHNNNNNNKSSNNSKSNTNNKSNGNSSNNSKSNTNNNSNNIKSNNSNNSNNKTAATTTTTTTARATPTTKAMATLRASTTTSTTKATTTTTTKVTCYIYHFSRSIAFVVETVWDYVGKFIVQAHFYSQPAQSKTLVNDCASGKHGQNRLRKTWHKYAQVDKRLHPIRSFVSAWKKVTGALGKKQPRTFILFKQITFDAKNKELSQTRSGYENVMMLHQPMTRNLCAQTKVAALPPRNPVLREETFVRYGGEQKHIPNATKYESFNIDRLIDPDGRVRPIPCSVSSKLVHMFGGNVAPALDHPTGPTTKNIGFCKATQGSTHAHTYYNTPQCIVLPPKNTNFVEPFGGHFPKCNYKMPPPSTTTLLGGDSTMQHNVPQHYTVPQQMEP